MLDRGYSAVDFGEVGDLRAAPDLPSMRRLLAPVLPGKSDKAVSNYAAQLNAFANRMEIGDIVVLPVKAQSRLAFGVVTGDYEYLNESGVLNHVRKVDWKRPDVARTAVHQDLLYSLGAFSTVVQISRNDAVFRLSSILNGSPTDPGARANVPLASQKASDDVVDADEGIASDGQDIEAFSRDRIRTRIREQFDGYGFQSLVAALLEAEGLTCKIPPRGRDGGIDIIAGSGVLGISAPTIIVQVKAQAGSISSSVLDQLGGVVSQHNADHGLLVTLSDLTKDARERVAAQQLKVAVWDTEEVIQRMLKHYELLPDDIKSKIPLKRVWLLDEGAEA